MTALSISVVDVRAQQHAASPHLLFRLRIAETSREIVHAIALRCQLRIEPQRRPYDQAEQEGLRDLFGTCERYSTTLKPFLWTHANVMVQGFQGSTEVELPVACSYDFDISATKYLHALRGGAVPLVLLFSGTVFTRGATGFSVEQLSWSLDAPCRLPVAEWRRLMDMYFPGGGWIRLHRDTLDALTEFRSNRGLTTWEQTMAELLRTPVATS
ncbi:MAG: DUF6084 family protein [Mycobacteriales bacterium]